MSGIANIRGAERSPYFTGIDIDNVDGGMSVVVPVVPVLEGQGTEVEIEIEIGKGKGKEVRKRYRRSPSPVMGVGQLTTKQEGGLEEEEGGEEEEEEAKEAEKAEEEAEEEFDTDTKIAILSSLFPHTCLEKILDMLIRNAGSMVSARRGLELQVNNGKGGSILLSGSTSKRRRVEREGESSSFRFGFGAAGGAITPAMKVITQQTSLPDFLVPSDTSTGTGTTPPLSLPKPRKGHPLLLFSPNQISALTPTTLITSFLPSHLASSLLSELVKEAEGFPKKESVKFNLFENKGVHSRHTSGFFVRGKRGMEEWYRSGYLYNGVAVGRENDEGGLGGVRTFTETMELVTELVESKVNEVVRERWRKGGSSTSSRTEPESKRLHHHHYPGTEGKKLYESPHPWTTNAALVNCYDGGGENVGWHTDQLTYLGPMSTIASISLGVGREFGMKKVGGTRECGEEGGGKGVNGNKDDEEEGGVIKIWLPHNSLLIMEAGTQEEWKHCVFPSRSITPHPISGNKRINITYRCYRPSLSPKFTPKCKCSIPCILRAVMDKKSSNCGKYFWACAGVYQGTGEKGEGCGFWQLGVFDENGEPEWWNESGNNKRSVEVEVEVV